MWITIPTRKAPNREPRDLFQGRAVAAANEWCNAAGLQGVRTAGTLLTGLWLACAGSSALGVGLVRVRAGVTCGRVPTGPPARQKGGCNLAVVRCLLLHGKGCGNLAVWDLMMESPPARRTSDRFLLIFLCRDVSRLGTNLGGTGLTRLGLLAASVIRFQARMRWLWPAGSYQPPDPADGLVGDPGPLLFLGATGQSLVRTPDRCRDLGDRH